MNIIEQIKKVEALIERAGTDGEQQSAILAKERLLKHKSEEEIEYTIHTENMWHKKLFNALCHKYNLKPYRYHRQKYLLIGPYNFSKYFDFLFQFAGIWFVNSKWLIRIFNFTYSDGLIISIK